MDGPPMQRRIWKVPVEGGEPIAADLLLVAVFPTNDFSNETLEANRRRAHGEPEPPAAGFPRELYVWQAWLGRVEAKLQRLFTKESPAGEGDGWKDNIEALGRIGDPVARRVENAAERDAAQTRPLLPQRRRRSSGARA